MIQFPQATIRNHLWACKRCYIALSPCGEAGADLTLLEAIEGRNDAEHWPGVGLLLFFWRRLGWDLTEPVLDLLPSGFYTLNPPKPTCLHDHDSQIHSSVQNLLWSKLRCQASSDLPPEWRVVSTSLVLAGEKLWVFPSHLLEYHRQHNTATLSVIQKYGGHASFQVIIPRLFLIPALGSRPYIFSAFPYPLSTTYIFISHLTSSSVLLVCGAVFIIWSAIIKQLVLQQTMRENHVSDSEIAKWLRKSLRRILPTTRTWITLRDLWKHSHHISAVP